MGSNVGASDDLPSGRFLQACVGAQDRVAGYWFHAENGAEMAGSEGTGEMGERVSHAARSATGERRVAPCRFRSGSCFPAVDVRLLLPGPTRPSGSPSCIRENDYSGLDAVGLFARR